MIRLLARWLARPAPAATAAASSTSFSEKTMNTVCELPAAARRADHSGFPDPARDLAATIPGPQEAVFAAGCFWCVEAVFERLDGVSDVISGYAGGTADTANYDAVCTGRTNHAEVVKIVYDPAVISYGQLLKVLFAVAHDPTQLDRQGNDRGRQYRSAIFFQSEAERDVAAAYIAQLDAAQVFRSPIVTVLAPLERFYIAETYHQDYAIRNPGQPYIAGVAAPKVDKLEHKFTEYLRK
jgi:peptide-methionine (S)-S-oxide reductase